MSNLIPSLETFAKVGYPTNSIPSLSFGTMRSTLPRGVFFFFFQAAFLRGSCAYGRFFVVVCLRGRLRRLRDWARWVSVHLSFEFTCMNRPRAGMGLLYYGQNFLIYPSAFPAGARESAFTLCPVLL